MRCDIILNNFENVFVFFEKKSSFLLNGHSSTPPPLSTKGILKTTYKRISYFKAVVAAQRELSDQQLDRSEEEEEEVIR